MTIKAGCIELEEIQGRAAEILGEPLRLLDLTSDVAEALAEQATPAGRDGLHRSHRPISTVHSGPGGHGLRCGIVRYVIRIDKQQIPVVHFVNPFSRQFPLLQDLWAVPERHYRRVYRFLRRISRKKSLDVRPPIMRSEDRDRLWNNTLGFLERGDDAMRRFGVAVKRGVLLTGEPGNGKTLAARWLRSQAVRRGLHWRTVSAEEYRTARFHGSAHHLFSLRRPGVVFFDDFDEGLREHHSSPEGWTSDRSTFLSELDGLEARQGIVYLFTSNMRPEELDPAFQRPGRIDQVIEFPRPDEILRRRLIDELWPAEIVQSIPVTTVVARTEGWSFAEVDEVKKLLIMRFVETGGWHAEWAMEAFRERGVTRRQHHRVGFAVNGRGAPRGT